MPTAAEKLLVRMRASKQGGWSYDDLERVYVAHGFGYRDKGKHRVYTHPAYPSLIATVTRHRTPAVGYVQTLIKLVDKLADLQQEEQVRKERAVDKTSARGDQS